MTDPKETVDLQQAVEQFLEDTRRRRSESVFKRYSKAMELLLTYLALELLDPESMREEQDEHPGQGPAGHVTALKPDLLERYTHHFLVERLSYQPKLLKRHLKATRAFVTYLASNDLIEQVEAKALKEITQQALHQFSTHQDEPGETISRQQVVEGSDDDAILYEVLLVSNGALTVLDLSDGETIFVDHYTNQVPTPPVEGDVCLMTLADVDGKLEGEIMAITDGATFDALQQEFEESNQEVGGEAMEEFGNREAFDEDFDEDDDDPDDDSADSELDDDLTGVEALEILSIEDRYAPRKVVEAILFDYEDVREELIQWLFDDNYRDIPFPGTGEAPANAARILSEMGEDGIASRLISVLGNLDPLGEEAPPALARLGPSVLSGLLTVLQENNPPENRRVAALWAIGFMAARHPAIRHRVIDILFDEVMQACDESQAALQILTELRATEVLPRMTKATKSGDLDMESMGYTYGLFEEQATSSNWGEIVAEILVPIVYLYPTDAQLEELYDQIEEDMDDWEDSVDWDELDHELSRGDGFDEDHDNQDDEDQETNPSDESNSKRWGRRRGRPGQARRTTRNDASEGGRMSNRPFRRDRIGHHASRTRKTNAHPGKPDGKVLPFRPKRTNETSPRKNSPTNEPIEKDPKDS